MHKLRPSHVIPCVPMRNKQLTTLSFLTFFIRTTKFFWTKFKHLSVSPCSPQQVQSNLSYSWGPTRGRLGSELGNFAQRIKNVRCVVSQGMNWVIMQIVMALPYQSIRRVWRREKTAPVCWFGLSQWAWRWRHGQRCDHSCTIIPVSAK